MTITWREQARRVIAAVMALHRGDDPKLIRRALREAYPFAMREYYPYKVWCEEVRLALGLPVARRKYKKKVREIPRPLAGTQLELPHV